MTPLTLAFLFSDLANIGYLLSHPWLLVPMAFFIWMFVDAIRRQEYVWAVFIFIFPMLNAILYYVLVYRGASPLATRGFELPGSFDRKRIKELQAQIHHLDKAHHYSQLGDIYFHQGNLVEAEKCYLAALERDREDIDTRAHLGQCLLRQNKAAEARPILEQICRENPKHDYGHSLMALAETLAKLGDTDSAVKVWHQVLESHSYARARVQLAELYLNRGEIGTARAYLEEVLADDAHASGFDRKRDKTWIRQATKLLRRASKAPGVLLALLLSLFSLSASAQSPSIRKMSPWAATPGRTTEIQVSGDHLDTVSNAWFSFRAEAAITNRTEEKISCLLTVPIGAPIGPAAFRLSNEGGVSSLQMIMIDDLPTGSANETNTSFQTAQDLVLPLAVDGNTHDSKSDYYKFQARKGQRLSIEVVAQRLGSQLDSVVRLLDAHGRELLYCDDDSGVGTDSRFTYLFDVTGEYFLELHDVGFQGGSSFRYHLRIGEFPLVTVPFPLAVPMGKCTSALELVGPSVNDIGACILPREITARRQMGSVRFTGGGPSGFFALATSEFATILESEPNDGPAKANQVPVPVTINGRFDHPRDRDFFQLEAAAGQRLVFQSRTRSAGSPCDVYMKLLQETGAEIAEVNLSSTNEGAITNIFKEAGRYRLLVEELNRGGGPGMNYRIDIFPLTPGTALSTDSDRVQITPGEAGSLKITAARFEYDGPITLLLDGTNADLSLEKNVIPEKKTEAEIQIKASSPMVPGQMLMIKLLGQTTNSTEKFPLSIGPALRKLFPLMTYPPPEFDELIAVGIKK